MGIEGMPLTLLVNPASAHGRTLKLLPAIEQELDERRIPFRVERTRGPRGRGRAGPARGRGRRGAGRRQRRRPGRCGRRRDGGLGDAARDRPRRARQRPRPRARHSRRSGRGRRGARRRRDPAASTSARPTASASSASSASASTPKPTGWPTKPPSCAATWSTSTRRCAPCSPGSRAASRSASARSGYRFSGYSVSVANSRAFGGGMFIAPDAELDDGEFDIVTVGEVGKLRFVGNLPKVFKGTHVDEDEVRVFRASQLELTASRPFPVYADGEHLTELPASLRILPRALSVLAPPARRGLECSSARSSPRRARSAPPAGPAGAAAARPCPGRLLLRLAPDALARLGARLDRGTTIVSATNGKTTTAGMIAAALEADGRRPVHNRAGSNMTWGVATALLEQEGDEGLFEVDEAWLLARSPRSSIPSLMVLGNLFRDQLDRYGEMEALADGLGEDRRRAGRSHPLCPQRRRPGDRRPRPRRGRRAARGRRLLRHRGRLAGAARAAARLRRQALPALRSSLRLRARLRRPPRPLLVPELRRHDGRGPTSPRRRSSCTAWTGSRVTLRTPARRDAAGAPRCPGLYNVYNALAAVAAALELGVAPRADRRRPGRHAGRLRPGRDDRRRRTRRSRSC